MLRKCSIGAILIAVVLESVFCFATNSGLQGKRSVRREMTLPEAIDFVRPSVVQIEYRWRRSSPTPDSGRGLLGTGFLVSSDGYVVTAFHVIKEGRRILDQVQAEDKDKDLLVGFAIPEVKTGVHLVGSFMDRPADVIDPDERHDLALLKVRVKPSELLKHAVVIDGKPLPIPVKPVSVSAQKPKDGVTVAISGYPLGEPVLITNAGSVGSSSSFRVAEVQQPGAPEWFKIPDISDVYLADVDSNPGNSGGPVYLVSTGQVIGVSVAVKLAPVKDQDGHDISIDGHHLFYSSGLTCSFPLSM